MSQVIDQKLFATIEKLSDIQKNEVLVFASSFLEKGNQYDKWQDKGFVAEMARRYDNYKNGDKMISADEVNAKIKSLFSKKEH